MNVIILSPDDVFSLSTDAFVEAARAQWPEDSRIVTGDESREYDVTVIIDRPGEPMFQVFHDRHGETIATDGNLDQAAEVALWVRSLLPTHIGGRLWMTNQSFSGHVELQPGMAKDDLQSGWVDHADHPVEL